MTIITVFIIIYICAQLFKDSVDQIKDDQIERDDKEQCLNDSSESVQLDEVVRRKVKGLLAVLKSGWLKKEFITQFRLAIPVVSF